MTTVIFSPKNAWAPLPSLATVQAFMGETSVARKGKPAWAEALSYLPLDPCWAVSIPWAQNNL